MGWNLSQGLEGQRQALAGLLTVLADAAEGFDFATGNLLKNQVRLLEGGVAFHRVQGRERRLGEHECLVHRLFARGEIGEEGIASAGALRARFQGEASRARSMSGEWIAQRRK